MHRLLAIAAFAAIVSVAQSAAAVPVTTSFTARIEDSSGPIDGLVNLNFKIYDAPTAGSMVWEETHTGVTADAGLIFAALGSIDPGSNGLDESVFTGEAMYLQISVNGDVQNPRVPILSVPYAVHAATADTLGNLAPSDVALSTHNHDSAYASFSHNHDSSYASLSHNHDSRYASLSHNHDARYASLSHNHDTDYAAITHNHSAANITSGTLSTDRFDGYADLAAAGRLDNNSSSDLLTRAQSDARFVGGVTPGSGLNGGGTSGTVTLSVDPTDFNGAVPAAVSTTTAAAGVSTATYTTLRQVTITHGGPGRVMLVGRVSCIGTFLSPNNDISAFNLGIDTDVAGTPSGIALIQSHYLSGNPTPAQTANGTTTYVFPVTGSGSTTFYLRARVTTGTGNCSHRSLSGIFIPN